MVKPTNNEVAVLNNTIAIEVVDENEKGSIRDVNSTTEIDFCYNSFAQM